MVDSRDQAVHVGSWSGPVAGVKVILYAVSFCDSVWSKIVRESVQRFSIQYERTVLLFWHFLTLGRPNLFSLYRNLFSSSRVGVTAIILLLVELNRMFVHTLEILMSVTQCHFIVDVIGKPLPPKKVLLNYNIKVEIFTYLLLSPNQQPTAFFCF